MEKSIDSSLRSMTRTHSHNDTSFCAMISCSDFHEQAQAPPYHSSFLSYTHTHTHTHTDPIGSFTHFSSEPTWIKARRSRTSHGLSWHLFVSPAHHQYFPFLPPSLSRSEGYERWWLVKCDPIDQRSHCNGYLLCVKEIPGKGEKLSSG